MELKPISNNINDYLKSSYYIDFNNQDIINKTNQLTLDCHNDIEIAKRLYYFVRDDIKHSWDIQDIRVTAKGSDVLKYGVGICYAKSNLLCAMLRLKNIPTGICYQRLTLLDDDSQGYVIHALNGIYIDNRWVRLDARGNKEGINAEFSIDCEKLAFPIRSIYDEVDYPNIYTEPLPITMQTLENSSNALDMYLHGLPSKL